MKEKMKTKVHETFVSVWYHVDLVINWDSVYCHCNNNIGDVCNSNCRVFAGRDRVGKSKELIRSQLSSLSAGTAGVPVTAWSRPMSSIPVVSIIRWCVCVLWQSTQDLCTWLNYSTRPVHLSAQPARLSNLTSTFGPSWPQWMLL